MVKDDYDVIVFKLLTYLYAVAKRKIPYNKHIFDAAMKMDCINDLCNVFGRHKHCRYIVEFITNGKR